MNDAPGPGRRTYLDVLRGVAVLIMIEAHVIDSWTRAADHRTRAFGESMILGGFGAPLFLFLAGIAVAMSAGSKARRTGDSRAAVRAVQRRGLEIFLLAFVFRFQSFVLSHSPAWGMLKVDILNIMGPSIILAATLWGLFRTARARIIAFAVATAAIVWTTPIVRRAESLERPVGLARGVPPADSEPDQLHVLPMDGLRDRGGDHRRHPGCRPEPGGGSAGEPGIRRGGLLAAAAAYKASFLPALGVPSSFWTTSASFFFIRLGLMTAAIGLAYLWEQRPVGRQALEPAPAARTLVPVRLLGSRRAGLRADFDPLHGAFSLRGAWIGLVLVLVPDARPDRRKGARDEMVARGHRKPL